eukprot:TRINITY_DN2_c1_g2_i1.p1 TRINITY_DN2_c1_g2~~TRINITY_DN2_c1_g2_i1.p1  ORF type:complete len:354 (+),score=31.95 TRINITY_DN2_c1_g2_i1:117-1178(+)
MDAASLALCNPAIGRNDLHLAPSLSYRLAGTSQILRQRCFISSSPPLHAFQPSHLPAVRSRRRGRSSNTLLPQCSAAATTTPSSTEPVTEVPPRSVSVVLLAGGVGKRMGASMPKQYLPLLGQPIALYSFYTFASLPEVGEIIVVCEPPYRHVFSDAAKEGSLEVQIRFALPGKERQDSVFNGLQEINSAASLVAVHDSARPLVTAEDTQRVLRDGLKHGASVLGVAVKATIKEASEDGQFIVRTLDRRLLWEMQTPQVLEPGLLRRGFEYVRSENLEVTDDVSIVEYLGHAVCITKGSYTNLKVTTPEDLLLAERIVSQNREQAELVKSQQQRRQKVQQDQVEEPQLFAQVQ